MSGSPILLAALFGACVGSFLNVVVWRLPRQESLMVPGSHCPRCGSSLRWFENLPVLSWLLQAGRCRRCGGSIAVRYPLVELLTAGLWVANSLARPTAMASDPQPLLLLLAGWLLLSWLIPLTLIDLDQLWLPEPLCRWGVLLGLAATALLGFAQGVETGRALLFQHLIAAALGLLGFEAVSAAGERLIGKPALGLGDAKLAALMGAWLGPAGLAVAVALAVVGGALFGGIGRITGRLGRQQPFPFGPFLIVATWVVWLSGHRLWIDLYRLASGI
jgi:leader peptidase (prepilin peptidase)/N-methyltransferase